MNVQMTKFALKLFPKESKERFTGTKITNMTSDEFVKDLNHELDWRRKMSRSKKFGHFLSSFKKFEIKNGYAHFCKIIAMENRTDARVAVLPITLENYQWLRSGYVKRNDDELSYLSRWFDLPVPVPKAEWLHIIVYSKRQLKLEQKNLNEDQKEDFHASWGIVNILAQNNFDADPIAPSTMLRNAMGVEFGGSGVPLNKEEYEKSVEFWNTHAIVR